VILLTHRQILQQMIYIINHRSKSIQDEIKDIVETLKRINIHINTLKKNANPKAMCLSPS